MSDTDMVLVDMNPDDPFDFYLDHYKEQLVAGYTKETPTFGLQVFMRDYNKLPRREDTRRAQTTRDDSLPANAKITNKVVQIIASIKQVSPEAIRMETTFDELGIDSLDRMNILFELESEFEVDIPDERAR